MMVYPIGPTRIFTPVQPVPPVQSSARDGDGDQDGSPAPIKAATPVGVGKLLDIKA